VVSLILTRRANLVLRYTACAIVSTLINLVTQGISFRLYQGIGELLVGIIVGTAMGLISKYFLDKFLIFDDRSLGFADNVHKFTRYSLTGAFTTVIFWGTEATFALLDDHDAMRYLGAVVGLSIGYVAKFHLDYRFVFPVKS
jgi:putative flippase GtrA